MKEYLVTYKLTAWIEAEDADEAEAIAENADETEFNWELVSIEEY